jgi:hypothetical protein
VIDSESESWELLFNFTFKKSNLEFRVC